MKDDLICPYCGHEIEASDYYENEQEEYIEQECPSCGKIYLYVYTMCPTFECFEAPCKNGGEHELVKIHGVPEEYFKYKRRCKYCSEEFIIDEEKDKESKEYFNKLEKQRR